MPLMWSTDGSGIARVETTTGPKGADLSMPKRYHVHEHLEIISRFRQRDNDRTLPVAPLAVNAALVQPCRDVVRARVSIISQGYRPSQLNTERKL